MDAASSGYSVAECLKVEAMSPVWCLAVDDGLIVAGCGDGSVEVGGSVTIFSHLRLCYFLSFPSEENRKHFCFRFSSDLTFPETPITKHTRCDTGISQVCLLYLEKVDFFSKLSPAPLLCGSSSMT